MAQSMSVATGAIPQEGLEAIRAHVESLAWYHTIDLRNGIVTPGHYDHRPFLPYYAIPDNLSAKTVLDIGAASGFFSFEMERRGARVVATELPEWMAHDFGPRYRPDQTPEEAQRYLHESFELARQILNSQVTRKLLTIYEVSPQTLGTFDLVFCGSVLLHLTDPVRALFNIQSVTRGAAIIATGISRDARVEPHAEFIGHHRGDAWWLPNRAGLEAMVASAGFLGWEWMSEFQLNYADGSAGVYHGVIRAWNGPSGLIFPITAACVEPTANTGDDAEMALPRRAGHGV